MTWLGQYRDWYFQLMTLSTAAPWDTPKGKKRVYTDGDHSFYEKDIKGNFDCLEEQLWAFRNGLTDIAFTITIRTQKQSQPRGEKRTGGGS